MGRVPSSRPWSGSTRTPADGQRMFYLRAPVGPRVFGKPFSTSLPRRGVASPNISDIAARLRYHARQHPTVASLLRDLPALPAEGTPEPGLYTETRATPGITVNGELRVSVLRLYSVTAEGKQLVGQLQATRVLDHPLASWRLHHYLHVPKFFATVRCEDETSWFMRVLEVHYRDEGADVAFKVEVPA